MFLTSNSAYQIIAVWMPLLIFAVFFASAVGAYIWRQKRLNKILKWGIGFFIIAYLVRSGYLVWLQYVVWQEDKFGAFLLPPNQPISYFLQYVWTHFLMDLPWIFGGALILFGIVLVLGIVSKGRMVDSTDALLALFGALIAGWPNMLAYFLIVLVLALASSLVYGIIKKQIILIPITPFFFAGTIIVFLWGAKITEVLGLGQLLI